MNEITRALMRTAVLPVAAVLSFAALGAEGGASSQGASLPGVESLPGADAVKAFIAARMAKGFVPPKMPWGDPDISGVFTTKDETNTPFERPDQWAGRKIQDITPQGFAAAVAERQAQAVERAPFAGGGEAESGVAIAVPIHWFDHLAARNARPWFVIEPNDGRIPPLTAAAAARGNAGLPCADLNSSGTVCSGAPAERTLSDRCIVSHNGGPWKTPGSYGNSFQLLQTPDYVVLRHEMMHEARMIPLDGRAHAKIRQYSGDARGRWDGNTLVVETTNLHPSLFYRTSVAVRGGQAAVNLRMIERFTRIGPKTVEWSVTMDNPTIWQRPWTYSVPMTEDDTQLIHEYACHEGNYGMANILSAGRGADKRAAGPAR